MHLSSSLRLSWVLSASVCFCFWRGGGVSLPSQPSHLCMAPALADWRISFFPTPAQVGQDGEGLCDHAATAPHSSPVSITQRVPFLGIKGPAVHPWRAGDGGTHCLELTPAEAQQHLTRSIHSPSEDALLTPISELRDILAQRERGDCILITQVAGIELGSSGLPSLACCPSPGQVDRSLCWETRVLVLALSPVGQLISLV